MVTLVPPAIGPYTGRTDVTTTSAAEVDDPAVVAVVMATVIVVMATASVAVVLAVVATGSLPAVEVAATLLSVAVVLVEVVVVFLVTTGNVKLGVVLLHGSTVKHTNEHHSVTVKAWFRVKIKSF